MKKSLFIPIITCFLLLATIAVYAGTTGISYNVTLPPLGTKVQILNDKKTEGKAYDYYNVSLTGGTASSIRATSNYGGEMKVYKGQGYAKIYYSTVPSNGSFVKISAHQDMIANQTASGKSYCN
jgi:hypothetical protein